MPPSAPSIGSRQGTEPRTKPAGTKLAKRNETADPLDALRRDNAALRKQVAALAREREAVAKQLRPIVKELYAWSRRNAATISFPSLAILAHRIQTLIDDWTK